MFYSSSWDFFRWEVNGHTVAVLWGVASSISSKQHVALLCSSNQAFSPSVLLESIWCIHIVILTQPLLGKNPVLFYFQSINNLPAAKVWELCRSLPLRVEMIPCTLFFLCVHVGPMASAPCSML